MTHPDSVSEWIVKLKEGKVDAAQPIWARYVERLIHIANAKLARSSRRVADEEDVVACAFAAFLRGVQSGRFSHLDDRSDLWQLLVMLTERKAVDQIRGERAEKRGGGRVRGESAFIAPAETDEAGGIFQLADAEPTPALALQATEELGRLLGQLNDDQLQRIAVAKLEGYTNHEIARQIGRSVSSVERKLSLIRDIWNGGSNR